MNKKLAIIIIFISAVGGFILVRGFLLSPVNELRPVAVDRKLLGEGCDKGNMKDCERLAGDLEVSEGGGLLAETQRKICTMGSLYGCIRFLTNISFDGDRQTLLNELDKRCETEQDACVTLYEYYRKATHLVMKERYRQKACAFGSKRLSICGARGPNDPGPEDLENSCAKEGKLTAGHQCHKLAIHEILIKNNRNRGMELLKRSCDLGYGLGCHDYAIHGPFQNDKMRVYTVLKQGCMYSPDRSCSAFLSRSQDFEKDLKLVEEKCEKIYTYCYALATYARDIGRPDLAKKYKDKARAVRESMKKQGPVPPRPVN